ncbi:MAG TPA: nucleoside deaminase [Acidimicrobiales bacterium]|nr:nucleoside deaminase [Acidimicrobiales bacterium]
MPTFSELDRELMTIALEEARAAQAHHDVPIGAVVAVGDRVIARRHNERELTGDPTAHAEILALRDAAGALGGWRFDGATMVVTIEPCVMCAGAAHQARLSRVVFGAFDLKAGALGSLYNVGVDARLNHEFAVDGGLMADQCGALVSQFFTRLRLDP